MQYYRLPDRKPRSVEESPADSVNSAPLKPNREPRSRGKGDLTPTQGAKYVLSVIGTTFLTLFLIIIITVCVVAVALTVYITQFADSMYDIDLRDSELNYSSFFMAWCNETEDWIEVLQLSADENRIWVDLEDIPPHVIDALVSTEDRRFFEHAGVDWTRTIYIAVNEMLLGGMDRMQGGSTITQQLVRDVTGDDDFNVGRKLREIFRALSLEQTYSKYDILESYLNRVAFGPTVYGVGSAARFYFDKEAQDLTVAEAAILVGLLPSPVGWNPYANPREARRWQGNTLWNMFDQGFISYTQYREAVDEQVQFRLPINPACRCPQPEEVRRPQTCDGDYFGYVDERWEPWMGLLNTETDENDLYFQELELVDIVGDPFTWSGYAVTHNWYIDAALKMVIADFAEMRDISLDAAAREIRRGGFRIYLNMDIEMQEKLEEAFLDPYLVRDPSRRYAPGTPARDTLQAGFVLMDMRGNIVAVAGGVGDKMGNDAWNRAVQSRRHIGSAVKPFAVYAPAVDLGQITYSTMLLDAPGRIPHPTRTGEFQDWPLNFGNNRGSGVGRTAYYAMAVSTNTQAARTLNMVGVRTAFHFVRDRLRVDLDPSRHMDFSPLAGGAIEVRLHEVAGAYQMFGNGGMFYRPSFYSQVVDHSGNVVLAQDTRGEQVIGADSAWVVNRMMRHVVNCSCCPGTARIIHSPMGHIEVVGKTGTANSMSDAVFAGLTPDYVGVIRIGFDDNREMTSFGVTRGDHWRRPAAAWADVMRAVIPTDEPRRFDELGRSSGAVDIQYCRSSGLRAGARCSSTRTGPFTASNIPPLCPHDGSEGDLMPAGAMESSPLYRAW
jgi:penicillin-binding protein 1A